MDLLIEKWHIISDQVETGRKQYHDRTVAFENCVKELFIKNGLLPFESDDVDEKTVTKSTIKKTPQEEHNKKKLGSIGKESSQDSCTSDAPLNERPTRRAKLIAENKLKEPSLSTKLRKPSIKLERESTVVESKKPNDNSVIDKSANTGASTTSTITTGTDENDINVENVKIEKKSIGKNSRKEGIDEISNNNDKNKKRQNDTGNSVSKKVKMDSSIECVTNIDDPIVILSDDDCEKMPPPNLPPPKHTKRVGGSGRSKKRNKSNSHVSVIKTEHTDIDECTVQSMTISSNSSSSTTRSTRSKARKGKIIVMPIKEEIIVEENTTDLVINPSITNQISTPVIEPVVDVKRTALDSKTHDIEPTKEIANTTMESVYTDAHTSIIMEEEQNMNCFVSLKRMTSELQLLSNGVCDAMPSNEMIPTKSTYIVKNINEANSGSQLTDKKNLLPEVSPRLDCTFDVKQINNETITINADKKYNENAKENDSLLTDDNSENETPPPTTKIMVAKKPNKELFNPCVKSPFKSKIAAFENVIQNDKDIRQMRSKTNSQTIKNNILKEPNSIKITTPYLNAVTRQQNTPNSAAQSLTNGSAKPMLNRHNSRNLVNSASKLAHLNQSNKCIVRSRDNSAEDIKRGIQAVAEEKKKKREEKLRHVQQQREAREREKIEKYKQQLEEKHEKMRLETMKKQELKEKRERERKLLEEINRNLKITETLKTEQKKDNQKKQYIADLNNRTYMENKNKFDKNGNNINDEHSTAAAIETEKQQQPNLFDLIKSDDSSDEESKPRKDRPEIPLWSKSNQRHVLIDIQQNINCRIIDSFFSVQPMTPDLREIFPEIDKRYLKRNSSAVWNSPLRYSQLPKY